MPSDTALLREITAAYDNDVNEWDDIQREGQKDVQVLSGGVWEALDEAGAKQRKAAKRPMLAPDEISQFTNQVVNDLLANPRGIKFSPTGGGASKEGADLYQNKTREIEYRSHAVQAYGLAAQNMVERGYGYIRVNKRYVKAGAYHDDDLAQPDPALFNQELCIDGVPNPDMILPDPYAQRTDLSDMKRCFVLEWRPVGDFKRDFPEAKTQNFTPAITANAKSFFTADCKQVLTAEYWSKDQIKTRKLLLLKPLKPSRLNPQPQPRAVWRDTLGRMPSSDDILQSRDVPVWQVKQRVTNGLEILSETVWQGKYIPITGCFGKTLYVDDGTSGSKKKILSLHRLARDPFLLYCYVRTCQAEVVGGVPKFPYFYVDGQLDPKALTLLAESLHIPVVGIPYKATIPGVTPPGAMLPPPTRNPYSGEALQYLELLAEAARRAIQAAMGMSPLPTQAQRRNEKSGKALQQMESAAQRGSFHLVDSYDGMVTQCGEIIQDAFGYTYDSPRDLGVITPLGKAETIRINDQADPKSVSALGDYQVTVSAGPSNESQQQTADDLVDTLVGNIGMVAEISGKKAAQVVLGESIRHKVQGPSGDQLADVINPPQTDGQMGPEQAQMAMAENQELKQAVAKLQQMVQADQVKYAAQFKIEEMKATKDAILKIALKRMDQQTATQTNAAKIETARISAAKQSEDLLAEAREEAIALGLEHEHESREEDKARAHEVGMAALGHGHSMAQSQHQADLQPPPEATV